MVTDLAELESLPIPATKAELLARIPPALTALEDTLTGLSDARLSAPGPEQWAAKDHLAHIAAWERLILAHVQGTPDHEAAGITADAYAAITTDELNDILYARTNDRPVAEVLADFREASAAIAAAIEQMTDADLAAPYWSDEPGGRTVMQKVAGDTYLHYLEHRRWILDLLAAQGP